MPDGSEYPGPPEALRRYREVVESGSGDAVVKGAKNPYTSRNGHMFSFLDRDGTFAIRLSPDLIAEYGQTHSTEPVVQYGSVMRGYVSVSSDLLGDLAAVTEWFDRSYDWIGTLDPK